MPQVTVNVSQENLPELLNKIKSLEIEDNDVLITSETPDWHTNILAERLANYRAGKTRFTTLEQLEKDLDELDKQDGK